jgi:hypothetical protein
MRAPGTSALHTRGIVDDTAWDSESCPLRLRHLFPACIAHHDCAMASLMRPSLVRHAVSKPATVQRMLSTITASTINRPLAQQLRPAFQRSAVPKAARVAAFHATQRNQILPPLPQKIEGTANDPTPVPDPSYAHGSYHWSFERCVFDSPGSLQEQVECDLSMADVS